MTDAEIDRLKPGDVIRSPSGTERTVISVHRDGRRRVYVSVPILRCSWTHACYTILDRTLLRTLYTKTRKQRQFKRTKLGRRVFEDCETNGRGCDCCDVIGRFK